jgi:adenosylmethionine-8-amino-7-oxononanoate aminotransferase
MSTPATILLARRLTEIAPPGLNHVFYSGDGSSAVEAALKIAFQYWQQLPKPQKNKTKFVAFEDAYHGDTIGSASVGGVERFHHVFRPLLFDTIRLPVPRTYPLPDHMTSDEACRSYLTRLESVLEKRHHEIAAVIIEPLVQAAAGMVMHPPGFLRGVREVTQRFDVLLIADEVAVGFGRTGKMFACEHEQVVPDLLCLGKGMTAGYLAMSATMTTDEIYNAFLGQPEDQRTFYHGNTYAGNALAAAVALASLDVFAEENLLDTVTEKSARLSERLRRLSRLGPVVDVRSRGLIGAVEIQKDEERLCLAARICEFALQHGVWLRPLENVVVIMPPLAISLDQLDRICLTVEKAIQQVNN